jgi:hypothetical protein
MSQPLHEQTVSRRLWVTVPIGLAAAVANQLLHEATHVVAALAVGSVSGFQLFAVDTLARGRADILLVAGSAAIVNILAAAVALLLARGPRRPLLRLGLLLFGGFSAATGFGYLMFDPLFASDAGAVGDYQVVVQELGGGAVLRVVLIAVGGAGWVATMFALAMLSWGFVATTPGPDGTVRPDRRERRRTAVAVLLAPYLAACVFFSVLVVPSHPLGAAGVVATLLQYWLGYSLFIWATGLSGTWLKLGAVALPVTPLPAGRGAAVTAGVVAVVVALAATPAWGF